MLGCASILITLLTGEPILRLKLGTLVITRGPILVLEPVGPLQPVGKLVLRFNPVLSS